MNFTFVIPVAMSALSRFHGGGFFHAPRWLRAAAFATPYAIFTYPNYMLAAFAFCTAFVGKNIGHEDFWLMGTGPSRPDDNTLTKVVKMTGFARDGLPWCVTGLALKGAIVALGTLNPVVISCHAACLPLAYFVGRRIGGGSVLAEYLSGLLFGLILLAMW